MSYPPPAAIFPANICKLNTGLTVIHQHMPTTPVTVVDVWVKAGAIAEPDDWSGMAHFLEHMIFKGTANLAPGVFDQAIETKGGMSNAATSHDYAHYFITTANQYLEDALPYLAELILHAAIPDDEFDREREVVLEEIRQAYDDPDWIGFQALVESIYQYHPYGRSVLGTEAKLLQQLPDEMRCFHQSHYQPDNMTVVVVGGVDQERAISLVSQAFQDFLPRSECPRSRIEAEPPITGIRRQVIEMPRLEQARLMLAWVGPGIDPTEVYQPGSAGESSLSHPSLQRGYGLDLLSVLLASGRSSRLVRELREDRRLVQGIESGFSLQQDSSLFTITAWLDPQDLERVEAIICDRLSELVSSPISSAELSRCQRLLCNDFTFSTETPGQLAGLYGYYHTIAHAEIAVTYPYQIQAFQPEDLQRLASHYLSPYHYAATILRPA
ncbi:MAG: pitrilysin family protein [Leptolyngbyaceae bacterium]|nr:pitrilysin family protein [Leptolyngbyaceae bacterium]